ncbi:MAG TPA: CPBP family glutamic-type intramembrane protease [Thermoanaerobaculia bacterium]|nr:CPBP family glutamic-type intramembrane protease [Thermoanaerobaculia bacterium]
MMPSEEIHPGADRLYRVAWVVYLLLAIAGAVWMGLAEGEGRAGLTLERFVDPTTWWLDLLWGAGAGAALLGLWLAGRAVLPLARELERAIGSILEGLSPSDAFALAVISGFAEELFFRGAVQGAWGVVAATVLFTLLHTGPGRPFLLWTAFALVAGAAFGALALYRGNLLAPIVAHVVVNAVNLTRLARATED